MREHIKRPPVGDPDRAARLREIALKAAAKRRANLAAGIVAPKSRATVKVAAPLVRRVIPVMDLLNEVGGACAHKVADLLAIVRIARGEDQQAPAIAPRFYCAGCERMGRSGHPDRHHTNGNLGRCEANRCMCIGFEQGREVPAAAAARTIPERITVNGQTYAKLGRGASRVTYDLGCGKHALKTLHKTDVGWGTNAMPFQSKAECDFYEQADDAMHPFLAAIEARSADYGTELVEKVDQRRPDDGEAAMRAAANRHGIRDLHEKNVGWRNGRMVILDFGFAPQK